MLKQLRYFFTMLLLAIVGNVSAQEVSWDLSNGEWTIEDGKVTNGKVTFTGEGTDNFKFNTGYFMMGKSGAYITLPTFDFDVEVIEVVGRSGASGNTLMNVFVGDQAVSTETKGCVETNIYQIAKDYQAAGTVYTLKVTSAHNAQITAINIYKKGEAPVTVTPPTITPNGGEVESGSKVQIAFDGALLYYTTDGSEPSMSNANAEEVSTSPATITINEGVTIKAIVYDDEDNPSDVVSATFTVKAIVEPGEYETVALPYEEVLVNDKGKFVVEGDECWTFGSYGAVASKKNVTSWLVSPIIDMTDADKVSMTFEHQGRYFTTPAEEATLWVREEGGEWTQVEISYTEAFTGTKWTSFSEVAVDLSAFAGKKAQIAFKYISSDSYGGWEIKNVKVQAGEVVQKLEAGLSYDVANFTATLGEANEFPALANPNTLTVAYSSTNEAVATVDATSGEITLVAAGQATIKAVFEGNDAYEPGEASYLLVVKEKEVAGTDKFELVTDASKLTDGDVIILAYENEEGKAWAMSTTQNANNRAANPVEIEDDGTIIPGSSIQQITVEEEYYFNVGDGYLYAAGTTGNWLRTEAEPDDNALADITIDENGDATIIFQGANTRNHMRFNPNNGNPMFSCYAETSSVKTLPRIYRKITGDTPALEDAELAYEVETFTATIGEDNEFPVLINPNELPVTYTSSDESVATIDEDGNITLVAAGETTITATSDETSEFKAGEASYLLVVEGEVTPIEYGKYQLVTDASTLAAGDEILIAYVNVGEEATVAQAIGSEQAANNRPAVDVTYNDDETLTPDATAQIITLEGDAEGWNFNVGNGYLYAASTTKNWLRTEAEADENAKATITIDEIGDATIVFQGENTHNTLRFNPNNGSPIFSCYGSTSTTGSLPRIYRKVAEVEGETVPVTISSAEWATLYYSDKAFEIPEGVTAKIVVAIDDNDVIDFEDLNGIIPAGTAVALNGPQGTYDFKVVNDETVAPANNLLRGFDAPHLTEGGDIYYKLTVKNDIVGFYWGEENGEAFESGEHKAYLAIPAGASNAKFFVLGTAGDLVSEDGGFVDGINEVTASDSKNEYFNLNGTRVNSLRKGIYIVGGKKVVIK